MDNKSIISGPEDLTRKLKVSNKKLSLKVGKLAVTARKKEGARRKLAVTAENLRLLAEEKENTREKLSVVEKKLSLKAEQLALTAKEKEEVRKKLAAEAKKIEKFDETLEQKLAKRTAELRKSYATLEQRVRERTQDLENANIAARNVLEDLQVEKEALANAKAKDEAILSSIGDGIIAVDTYGKIIVMNKVAEKLLDWQTNEVVGKHYREVVILKDDKGMRISPDQGPLAATLSSPTTTTTTSLFLHGKNKIKFPVAITVSPIISDNKVIGAVEVFRDITKEQAVDKAKTEFVSLASHQLRTPLSTINWYTEMLLSLDVGKLTPKQRQYAQEVYHASQRMVSLVNALLNVSRLELGTFTVEPKPVDITQIVRTAIREIKPQIIKKKLIFKQKYDRSVSTIKVDPKLIMIVFQNLLSNSVKYTKPGGDITLSISKNKDSLLIAVADTGIGIPKDQQEQIFGKLFRGDNAKKIDPDGSGLGLYIVKEIINYTGGKVWFKSDEGRGSVFYVSLPLTGMHVKAGNKKLV